VNALSRLLLRWTMAAATAGSLLTTAAGAACVQTGHAVSQPQYPGHASTDLGPRNMAPDGRGGSPCLHFSFSDRGWNPAAAQANGRHESLLPLRVPHQNAAQ
jgi:hypothetical protein